MRRIHHIKFVSFAVIIMTALLLITISVYTLSRSPTTNTQVRAPKLLVYTFRTLKVSGAKVQPLFPRMTYPERLLGRLYKELYGFEPSYLVGLYSVDDYIILLSGDAELIIVKVGENSSYYDYILKLVLHNVTLIHYTNNKHVSKNNSLLNKLNFTDIEEKKIYFEGRVNRVLITKAITVSSRVLISKTSWECLEEKTILGTWIYFIPSKPFAMIEPILYVGAPQGKTLVAVYLIEEEKSSTALPLQPSLIGEHTRKLIDLGKKNKLEWLKVGDKGLELTLNKQQAIPISIMIPYKLVYNEDNILIGIRLTNTTLDCSCPSAHNTIMQEENAFLIPPSITKTIGRAVLIAPYNRTDSMLELALDHIEQ